jgi:hypothetical protein
MNITKVQHGNRWFTIYRQEWGCDCGPTCVAMAKQELRGTRTDISWLRNKTKAALVSPNIENRIQALGLQSRDKGTQMGNLIPLIKLVGLKASPAMNYGGGLMAKLRTANRSRLFICHISWGHFVVVPFVDSAGNVVVLDPYYGLQTTNNLNNYNNRAGHFSGWAIEVTT